MSKHSMSAGGGPVTDAVNAITVAGANKHYGDFAALDNVDFVVPKGSLTALLGPSGSGKSTLLRAIAGLDHPDSGTVTINGRDVTGVPPQKRGIGFVFQHYAAFKHLTVRDNVAFGPKIRKRPKAEINEKVDNLLEVVGLAGFQNRYPSQLSGGQRQRMALARALAVDPEILLCDEPFSALDPLIRRDMQNELIRLQTNLRKTLVFITHDFLEAIKLGDRIAIMKDGEIVQIGTPEQIVAHPVNDYVREFTKDVPRVKVLTARSVMKPVHDKAALIGKAIAIDTTLEALIPLTVDSDQDVPIVDEQQNLVGLVDRKAVMLALADTIVEIGESVE